MDLVAVLAADARAIASSYRHVPSGQSRAEFTCTSYQVPVSSSKAAIST